MNNLELQKKWKYKNNNYTKDVWLVSFISSVTASQITSSSDNFLSFTDQNYKDVCSIEKNCIFINDNHPDEKITYLLVGYCAYQNYKFELVYIDEENGDIA